MRDLDFVSGRFFEHELPKEKHYLFKYFATPVQEAFLKYFFIFGDWRCFREHTGFRVRHGLLKRQETKLQKLESAYKKAKDSFDLDTLWAIENGKYKL